MDSSSDPLASGGSRHMTLPAGVVANAPYVGRAPRLPGIQIPWPARFSVADGQAESFSSTKQSPDRSGFTDSFTETLHNIVIRPSSASASIVGLNNTQLHQITGDRPQEARQDSNEWSYDMRRAAQPVLDFLYLGPSTAARDKVFLRRTGITLLIAVRDIRLAMARLLSVESIADEMGIESQCVDVSGQSELIKALPSAIQAINKHMLGARRDGDGVSTGKVLVFCETGNVRSATVVAAYIMGVYGLQLVQALQFVNKRRFCSCIDEETKHMLQSYGEILQAQRDVAQNNISDSVMLDNEGGTSISAKRGIESSTNNDAVSKADTQATTSTRRSKEHLPGSNQSSPVSPETSISFSSASQSSSRSRKRNIEDTMEIEDDRIEGLSDDTPTREASAEVLGPQRFHLDMARYQDRKQFVPFTDTNMS